MAGIKSVVGMLVITVVFLAAVGEAAVGCSTVASSLNPCIPYVTGKGPLGTCCSGVKGLNDVAKTTPDRQSVCNCLKSLANSFPSTAVAKAAGLPGQCGVSIPYKISPSTDCSKVQ